MYTIATLNDIRGHLQLADDDTASDADLLKALQQASHLIESLTNRRYCPHVESRIASIDTNHPTELILPDDLLSLTSLTNGDGTAISTDDIELVPQSNDVPASTLMLINGESFTYSESAVNAITINGTWGWHDRWSQAWRDSKDTVQDDPLSDSATSITVTDADGSDGDGFNPRFEVGQLLRIESEFVRVLAVDTDNNQLTVLRGVHGTSASEHIQGAVIYTYQPVPAIRDLCVRYAELLFKSIGVFDTHEDATLRRLRRIAG